MVESFVYEQAEDFSLARVFLFERISTLRGVHQVLLARGGRCKKLVGFHRRTASMVWWGSNKGSRGEWEHIPEAIQRQPPIAAIRITILCHINISWWRKAETDQKPWFSFRKAFVRKEKRKRKKVGVECSTQTQCSRNDLHLLCWFLLYQTYNILTTSLAFMSVVYIYGCACMHAYVCVCVLGTFKYSPCP